MNTCNIDTISFVLQIVRIATGKQSTFHACIYSGHRGKLRSAFFFIFLCCFESLSAVVLYLTKLIFAMFIPQSCHITSCYHSGFADAAESTCFIALRHRLGCESCALTAFATDISFDEYMLSAFMQQSNIFERYYSAEFDFFVK